jgi:hypothetical protein
VADAVWPRERRDGPAKANGAVEPPNEAEKDGSPVRPLFLLWSAIVTGLAVYLALGVIRVGAGGWFGRRMSIRRVWSRFLDYLADLGAPPLLVSLVAVAVGLTVIGAAYALWLAFTLRDLPDEEAS